ncbi:MAG TPA: hydantoinase/oxoprolinase family protein [Candidatus Methylomirabilis sp.]|nr:hydantoinase/oxoprolinase family protein [Candidatus Methylomirabilis sp.]
MRGAVRVGLDVGGTFTDLVCWDGGAGRFALRKVPTTPTDIAAGLLEALAAALPPGAALAEVAHGTTVATNALLERKGARVGLLTTAGFRDLLELRDGGRRRPFGWQGAHAPLVPRALRREIPERISAAGAILTPLGGEAVEREARALLEAGVEAVAVAFLNAHQNAVHEEEAVARLGRCWPSVPAIPASALTTAAGEFTRTCTAVLSAYLHPLLHRYVRSLVEGVTGRAGGAAFRFIDSAAGSMSPEAAGARPLLTLFSGPAGGLTAAAALARLTGADALVSCDMGGTSFDVGVIRRGTPDLAAERELEFGLRVALPTVDVSAAAAGGGSLAWIDEGGLLQVGPESAGAVPGPACFGRGGRKPTVTDADLLLGRLSRDALTMAETPLDRAAAHRAFVGEICPTVGGSVEEAAEAVLQLAEEKMAGFIRRNLALKGLGPSEATLVAFGGAGPLHAAALASRLGIRQVLVPYLAAGFSALGCLLTPPGRTVHVPCSVPLASLTEEAIRARILRACPEVERAPRVLLVAALRRGRNPAETVVTVPFPQGATAGNLAAAYRAAVRLPGGLADLRDLVLSSLLVRTEEAHDPPDLKAGLAATLAAARETGVGRPLPPPRAVRIGGRELTAPVLPVEVISDEVRGPALVEIPGATVLVPPGVRGGVDRWGTLVLEVSRER